MSTQAPKPVVALNPDEDVNDLDGKNSPLFLPQMLRRMAISFATGRHLETNLQLKLSPLLGKCQTAYYPQFQALITSLLPWNMALDYTSLVVQDMVHRFRAVFFIS